MVIRGFPKESREEVREIMALQSPQIQDEIKIIKIFELEITSDMNRKQILKILKNIENATVNTTRLNARGYARIHVERRHNDIRNSELYELTFQNEKLETMEFSVSGHEYIFETSERRQKRLEWENN